jgi:hypothetical protein
VSVAAEAAGAYADRQTPGCRSSRLRRAPAEVARNHPQGAPAGQRPKARGMAQLSLPRSGRRSLSPRAAKTSLAPAPRPRPGCLATAPVGCA